MSTSHPITENRGDHFVGDFNVIAEQVRARGICLSQKFSAEGFSSAAWSLEGASGVMVHVSDSTSPHGITTVMNIGVRGQAPMRVDFAVEGGHSRMKFVGLLPARLRAVREAIGAHAT